MKIIYFLICWLVFSFCTSFIPPQSVEQSLQNFAQLPGVKQATWGFYAQNISTKAYIAKNEDAVLLPASSMKLFPCLAAMELLGPTYKFETSFGYQGLIENHVLKGNITILAQGDPTLASARFPNSLNLDAICDRWIAALKKKGIQQIQGQLVIDESYFPSDLTPGNWAWADLGNYFGASPCAFNLLENTFQLHFKQSNPGEAVSIQGTTPTIPDIQWTNRVKSGPIASGDNAWVFGAPKSFNRYIEGTIPPGNGIFTIKASMPDPAYFFKKYFITRLQAQGIAYFPQENSINESITILDKIYSADIQEIAKVTLDKSINLFAEVLLLHVGKKLQSSGKLNENLISLKSFLESKKINLTGSNISDGSGLSRTNLVSAKQFSDLISTFQANSNPWLWEVLPIEAGLTQVRCKSGYVARVRSFAGLVKKKNGQMISFGFIINGFSGPPGQMYQQMIQVLQTLATSDL